MMMIFHAHRELVVGYHTRSGGAYLFITGEKITNYHFFRCAGTHTRSRLCCMPFPTLFFNCFRNASRSSPRPHQKTILYVEDDRLQALIFIRKCECIAPRCSIVHETDGAKALRRLKRGEKYDIVISDVHMPVMDGIAFFQTMFSNNLNERATANIAVTATPAASSDPADAAVHKKLSILVKNFNVLVYNKSNIGVNLAREIVKPLLESSDSRCSVDDARMVINGGTFPWKSSSDAMNDASTTSGDVSTTSGDVSMRSGKSVASSIGDKLFSVCSVDGVRVRAFYPLEHDR